MPLNSGSPHVALVPNVAVGSPAINVPVLVSVKIEYVTGAGGLEEPSPFCEPVPTVAPANAFAKTLASKLNICAIGSLNSMRFPADVCPRVSVSL
jgi:hypothetical protein